MMRTPEVTVSPLHETKNVSGVETKVTTLGTLGKLESVMEEDDASVETPKNAKQDELYINMLTKPVAINLDIEKRKS